MLSLSSIAGHTSQAVPEHWYDTLFLWSGSGESVEFSCTSHWVFVRCRLTVKVSRQENGVERKRQISHD